MAQTSPKQAPRADFLDTIKVSELKHYMRQSLVEMEGLADAGGLKETAILLKAARRCEDFD